MTVDEAKIVDHAMDVIERLSDDAKLNVIRHALEAAVLYARRDEPGYLASFARSILMTARLRESDHHREMMERAAKERGSRVPRAERPEDIIAALQS